MQILFLGTDTLALQKSYLEKFLAEGRIATKKDLVANPSLSKDCNFIFSTWGMETFSPQEIETFFPSLQAVFYAAGSVQNFARPFLCKGIKVFSAWAANAVPVAEFTVAQIILSNKGYFPLLQSYREKGFASAVALADHYPGNYKSRVGLLGLGMIGREVLRLLQAYDLEILVFDPFLSEEKALELGVTKATLETVFSTCKVISNHLACNDKTFGLLDYSLFSKMQSYTTFINTARGKIVNEEDLKRAMKEDSSRYALLDVTDPLEPRDTSDELFSFGNILVTPHRAGAYMQEIGRLGAYMVEEYHALLEGKSLRYEITDSMLETMA
jgi:phosphoglycerate dehydrogenase-like enzyme